MPNEKNRPSEALKPLALREDRTLEQRIDDGDACAYEKEHGTDAALCACLPGDPKWTTEPRTNEAKDLEKAFAEDASNVESILLHEVVRAARKAMAHHCSSNDRKHDRTWKALDEVLDLVEARQRTNEAKFKVGDRVRALTYGAGDGTVSEVYRRPDGSWAVSMTRDGTVQNPAAVWKEHASSETDFEFALFFQSDGFLSPDVFKGNFWDDVRERVLEMVSNARGEKRTDNPMKDKVKNVIVALYTMTRDLNTPQVIRDCCQHQAERLEEAIGNED